jgi:hypothetical protein
VAPARDESEAADRFRDWQRPRHLRRLSVRAGDSQQHSPGAMQSFLQIMVMLIMAYVGLAVGANKGDLLNLAALGRNLRGRKAG